MLLIVVNRFFSETNIVIKNKMMITLMAAYLPQTLTSSA